MNDIIGCAHMQQGNLAAFIQDRSGNANSALILNNGYTQVPAGFYFTSGAFTISAWIFPFLVHGNDRLIDFGNSQGFPNIILALNNGTHNVPHTRLVNDYNQIYEMYSTQLLPFRQWSFLAATFDGSWLKMYINGIEVPTVSAQNTSYAYKNLTFSQNYIGKSNQVGIGFSNSSIDDLRFYDYSLSNADILSLMNL